MSYLLAAGDSWTDAKFQSDIVTTVDCSFPKWPELLGQQLGIPEVVNVGKCGAGNGFIFEQCYDKIINKKPKLICVLLSDWSRRSVFNYSFNTFTDLNAHIMHANNYFPADEIWMKDYYNDNIEAITMTYFLWQRRITVDNMMIQTLRDIFLFQSYCTQHNIDYLIMQGTPPMDFDLIKSIANESREGSARHTIANYMKSVLDSPYTSKLNERNLPGWPFFWQIGGYTVSNKFNEMGYSNFQIHPLDFHPNALGHRTISDMFEKAYGDVYGKVS